MSLKRILAIGTIALCLGPPLALTACATPPAGTTLSSNDQAIAAAVASYNSLTLAIQASNAAIQANILKGNDADKVVAAAATAKAGLDSMLQALRVANTAPTAGVPK